MDIVAIEGKFHFSSVTNYRYRYHYRSFLHTHCVSSESSDYAQKTRARAFAELVMDMEGALEEGIYVFKLAELHTTYESSLKTLNITSSINRTRLKRELMEHFQEHGMQEQSDGKQVVAAFQGMHSLPPFSETCRYCEATLIHRVASQYLN